MKRLDDPILDAVLKAFSGAVFILNKRREIVASNDEAMKWVGCPMGMLDPSKRPGDAFHCKYLGQAPGGCGTGKHCERCGTALAILASQKCDGVAEAECILSTTSERKDAREHAPFEFKVRATPVKIGDEKFTILVLNDISDLKRRESLERVFFHDILNTLSALKTYAGLFKRTKPEEFPRLGQRVLDMSDRLVREVETQRELVNIERHLYEPQKQEIRVDDVLTDVEKLFAGHDVSEGKSLEVLRAGAQKERLLLTDPTLLNRVLINMVKNALEATAAGGRVRLWTEGAESLIFKVSNPGVIPPQVAERIFEKHFSTKSETGRGLGTYSMKLLGERYLGGEVGFATRDTETVFHLSLPISATADR